LSVYDQWQRVYGGQFGFGPNRMRRLWDQGSRDINEQYTGIQRQATTDLGSRGFYSARPMQRMMGEVNTGKMRALGRYRLGLEEQSQNLVQQQKGQLFQGLTQEEMGKQQQAYAMVRMAKQQEYTVENLSTQQRYTIENMLRQQGINESLIELQHRLGKSNFWDFVGNVVGQGLGIASGIGLNNLLGGGEQ